ncbi:hypothetical protein [Dechloromonas sp. ZS-1]|uniref:hypothetical protein n=1 Tax=Dechloromonas sp. ZS-1 TaxID=3138067 RepID=UPI0031FBD949
MRRVSPTECERAGPARRPGLRGLLGVLGLFGALSLASLAQAGGCPPLPPPSVSLIRIDPEVSINTQLTHMQIQALIPPAQRSGNPVPGLTQANAHVRYRLELRTLPSLDGQGECTSPKLVIHYGFTPITLYISRELLPPQCGYREILAHEERHLAAYRTHADAIEPALRRTLEARFLNSPITPQPPGAAQRSLREELQQHWKPYLRQQLADAQAAQQHIDTDSEYRRLNAACQGEIREKLRP